MISVPQKNHKAYKEAEKYGFFKGNNKSIEIIPEKDLMADTLEKS